MEKDAYYEQLLTAQVRFSKGGIVMVMGNLNAKVDFGDSSLRHLMGMHGLSDGKNNGERFVNFRNFHWIVIGVNGSTLFQAWRMPQGE